MQMSGVGNRFFQYLEDYKTQYETLVEFVIFSQMLFIDHVALYCFQAIQRGWIFTCPTSVTQLHSSTPSEISHIWAVALI